MGLKNTLYIFFENNIHLPRTEIINKAKEEFPNKSKIEIIAKLNYWEYVKTLNISKAN